MGSIIKTCRDPNYFKQEKYETILNISNNLDISHNNELNKKGISRSFNPNQKNKYDIRRNNFPSLTANSENKEIGLNIRTQNIIEMEKNNIKEKERDMKNYEEEKKKIELENKKLEEINNKYQKEIQNGKEQIQEIKNKYENELKKGKEKIEEINKKYEEDIKKEKEKYENLKNKYEDEIKKEKDKYENIKKKYENEINENKKYEENKKIYDNRLKLEKEKYQKDKKKYEEEKEKEINDLRIKYKNLDSKYKIDLKKISEEKMKLQEKIATEENKKIESINKIKKENEVKERELKDKISQKENELNNAKNNVEKLKKENEELKNPKTIVIGLNNIGATCYMNATLQCLSNTKELTNYFLTKYTEKQNNIMTNEYHKLIVNLWNKENNNSSYSPYSFKEVLSKENPLFAGIAANDSKDLINFLLERFHLELNLINNNNTNANDNYVNAQQEQFNEQIMLNLFLQDFKEKYNSIISNLFYGVMETQSKCLGCQMIKYNFQIYSFLEFPLQEVNKYCFNNNRRPLFNNDGTNPDVNLSECFEYYGKVDLMNGDNQMYCNICNKLYDALYSTSIYSTPNNLIINLNRGKGAVYECKVNFPDQLNLYNFVKCNHDYAVFELYAVISHLGPSSMSGHFVAYCKNRMDNKWYLYNDGLVNLCTRTNQYQDGMPYILFYRSLRPL